MIGHIVTSDKDGNPIDNNGNKLSVSAYQPNAEVKTLWARVQTDYQVAYTLQHRSWKEFDDMSLLDRARVDQETFGAYVSNDFVPQHKRWRWRGRKNTSRNKLMGILSRMIAGMLYPFVYAKNEKNEEDKMTARVMRILVEEHLRKAGYENKFLFMILTALVNPAVFVEVEYIEAMQRVKQRLANGEVQIIEAVDELLSGLNLNLVPIDELMLADFYTGDLQRQPYLIRVRRISYDQARKIYADKFYETDGKDLFDYVEAGKTRVVLTGQENQTLYDIVWNESDRDFVQEVTAYYRDEDLQVTWVGGVFIGDTQNVYNTNPFQHRRLTLLKDKWISVPIYPFVKSYYEPLDPTGRFAYGKSGAFKEYWDDQSLNAMHGMVHDGTKLDIFKPVFLSGVAKIDGIVIAPGAATGMPSGASATFQSIGPNLKAGYDYLAQQDKDLSVSTQDDTMSGITKPDVTATQTAIATQQAKIALGVFGLMIADLIKQVGELTMDCVIQYTTVGELDTAVPGSLDMKFKTFLAKGKDKGKDITNRVVFTSKYMGRRLSKEDVAKAEWDLHDKAGSITRDKNGKKVGGTDNSDQRIYEVNPYQFARYNYTMYVDADKIMMKSLGTDRKEKMDAFNVLTDPRVAPFTDQQAVINDFAIEEYGGDDPDKYKSKGNPQQLPGMQSANPIAPSGSPPGVKPLQLTK